MGIELIPTIGEHVKRLAEEPLPCRIRSWTAMRDGDVLGIGGFAYLPDGTVSVFVQLNDEARNYPIALHKAAMMTLREARRAGYRQLVALADNEQPAAERWLLRLGFRPVEVDGRKAFVWTP